MNSHTVEIVCDESGSEGEKLIGGTTDVFAHASLDVSLEVAQACIERVRVDARSPANEVKASVVLRGQNRRVLEWLLGTDGPLHGCARVHLTEKRFHLTARMAERLVGGPPTADELAQLYSVAGTEEGDGVLHVFNELMRGRQRLDPLVDALAAAVNHWSQPKRSVLVVHDTQNALKPARLHELRALCGQRLAGVRFVDSQADARVQVADFLAGAARWIASEELNGRPDDGLTGLLQHYVDPASIWGDQVSGVRLGTNATTS